MTCCVLYIQSSRKVVSDGFSSLSNHKEPFQLAVMAGMLGETPVRYSKSPSGIDGGEFSIYDSKVENMVDVEVHLHQRSTFSYKTAA